eukprot:TRINITY_DN90868_c0_g1_i1.p1 TRINITY_DN90868_c0_g1~~TRINITY_DN90868_c0_g1_i1.p1  ORF type:complete len:520 (-),score=63.10 TRINITY_DN90868_c0_g1_i1:111-1670(-)
MRQQQRGGRAGLCFQAPRQRHLALVITLCLPVACSTAFDAAPGGGDCDASRPDVCLQRPLREHNLLQLFSLAEKLQSKSAGGAATHVGMGTKLSSPTPASPSTSQPELHAPPNKPSAPSSVAAKEPTTMQLLQSGVLRQVQGHGASTMAAVGTLVAVTLLVTAVMWSLQAEGDANATSRATATLVKENGHASIPPTSTVDRHRLAAASGLQTGMSLSNVMSGSMQPNGMRRGLQQDLHSPTNRLASLQALPARVASRQSSLSGALSPHSVPKVEQRTVWSPPVAATAEHTFARLKLPEPSPRTLPGMKTARGEQQTIDGLLCPRLVVPPGIEFLIYVPEVINRGRQQTSFSIVDGNGSAISRVDVLEHPRLGGSTAPPAAGVYVQFLDKTPLGFIRTDGVHADHRRGPPVICRADQEEFASVLPGKPGEYAVVSRSGRTLLTFRGNFPDKRLNAFDEAGNKVCATKRCSGQIFQSNHACYCEVRVAENTDAGLVLCGLLALEKIEGLAPRTRILSSCQL